MTTPLTPDEWLLEQIQGLIPEATLSDIQKFRDQGLFPNETRYAIEVVNEQNIKESNSESKSRMTKERS